MLVFGTREQAALRRRSLPFPDGEYFKSEWMSTGDDPTCSPTIFLVEQPPNTTIPLHFHRQNQFQLFVDGSGRIGNHNIQPVTVHYAGAYTVYGPLLSGAEGLKYFTIRPVFETGALVAKDSRDAMRKGPKRFAQSEPSAVVSIDALRSMIVPVIIDVIPMQPDGLAARVCRLPPETYFDIPVATQADCHFVVVLAGSILLADSELGAWESAYLSGTHARRCTAKSGSEGVELVVMSTPIKDDAYR